MKTPANAPTGSVIYADDRWHDLYFLVGTRLNNEAVIHIFKAGGLKVVSLLVRSERNKAVDNKHNVIEELRS